MTLDHPDRNGRTAFSVGAVRVEPDRNALFVGDRQIRIEPKVMDVFVELAAMPGEVVSREQLIDRVWGVEFGGDESASRSISLLRKALREAGLGDDAIETVPKRGYRLAAGKASTTADETDAVAAVSSEPVHLSEAPQKWRNLLIAGVLAALVAIVALAFYGLRGGRILPTELPAVAILPFDDLSPEGDHAWFAEGLADELIDNLAQAPGLKVISRSSSFGAADDQIDARAIGDRLGARYLVEGGVRRDGDSFRISARLVDSQTGATVWSKTYEQQGSGIFETQIAIASDIAGALNVRLASKAIESMRVRTDNPQAFDALLLGHAFIRAEGSENIARATEQFRLAIRLDPDFVDAWEGLSAVLATYDFWHPDQFAAAKAERRAAVNRAAALTPRSDGIRMQLAWFQFEDGDVIGAIAEMGKIVPRWQAGQCGYYDFLDNVMLGRFDAGYAKCLEIFTKANSYALNVSEDAQFIAHQAGRDDIAAREYERSKSILGGPGTGEIYEFLRVYRTGNRDAARAQLRKMLDFLPAKSETFEQVYVSFADPERVVEILNAGVADPKNQDPTRLVMLAKLLAIHDDPKGAAEALRRHYLEVGGTWWQELWMPEHAATRREPAFREIIRKKGLEAYFRSERRWNDFCRPTSQTEFECA
jgi:TolB-like protein/DNA-binding winged helix-turn-helix (wHTH) protein